MKGFRLVFKAKYSTMTSFSALILIIFVYWTAKTPLSEFQLLLIKERPVPYTTVPLFCRGKNRLATILLLTVLQPLSLQNK